MSQQGSNDGAGPDPASIDLSHKTIAEILGEVVWLMTQDKDLRRLSIGDIEALIMPAILYRQIKVFYAPQPPEMLAALNIPASEASAVRPVGAVLWAMVSDAVAMALDVDKDGTLRLTPQDWRSGGTRRIVRVIAPFGGEDEMVKEIGLGRDD